MPTTEDAIERLREIAENQLELLRLALYLMSEGPVEREGEVLQCNFAAAKSNAVAPIAMAAGQSLNTILKATESRGIPVRDLYPVARSAIEAFVNAAYLVAAADDASERALRYVGFAAWKHRNRTVGSGDFSLTIESDPDPEAVLRRFPDFAGKGNGSWTKFDTPTRIRLVGELGSRRAGARLLAAYALVYAISSEVIHGSTYGVSYFFHAHLQGEPNAESFRDATAQQLIDILIAALHGLAGFLTAFFDKQSMTGPSSVEQDIFERLLRLANDSTAEQGKPAGLH
jgi:hypothetical protein